MDLKLYIPIFIVVASNTVYHVCSKSVPAEVNTFASLSVTYAVGAAAALVLYFLTRRGGDLLAEYHKLNWTSFALGLAIVGLEAGFLLMYRAGWSVSTGQVVQSAFLAAALLVAGYVLYREPITARKVIGIIICMAGLYLVNK